MMKERGSAVLPYRFLSSRNFILILIVILPLFGCAPHTVSTAAYPPVTTSEQVVHPEPTNTIAPPLTPTLPLTAIPTTIPPLTILTPPTTVVERYDLLELDLRTTLKVNNPFDPDEINIEVIFRAPSGKEQAVGAFWFQDYDLQTRQPTGQPGWKVRFTPTETGPWSAVAKIAAKGLESEAISFQVVESDRPGFVRINPTNPRYLALDNGDFFFPIGLNMAWWGGGADAVTDYGRWMDLFASNGGNTIRVWMAYWSFGIEWNDTPLGNYNNRLYQAWLLDQILSMAEDHNIYIDLVLLNCADFNNWQTNGWNENPYNAANGGPLESPAQFVTDTTARALLQRRLNYIVNRWGYAPHLLAWEWWNEVNLSGIPDDLLLPWYKEMTAYIKAKDINKHLVTNSYAISDTSPSWLLPEMEIIQKHEYASQEATSNKDLAERVVMDFKTLVANTPPKPALLGEFGYGDEGYGNEADKTGIHLHNGIWATTFAGYAGSGMYWWWDVYVEKYRLWKHFNGLSTFLEGVDLTSFTPFSPVKIEREGNDESQAFALGLRGEDTLVWLRSNAYTVQASVEARQGTGGQLYIPPLLEGLILTLKDMPEGVYTVSWFDPQTAKWQDEQQVSTQGGSLSIPIPRFRYDLAAKIVRNP